MHEHGPYWDINTPVVTSRSRRTKLRFGTTKKKRNDEKIKKLRKIAKQSKRKNRGGKK